MLPDEDEVRRKVIRKAAWRLLPFMGLLYFVSFLDRVNVSFAALTMNADIGLSAGRLRPGRRHLLHRLPAVRDARAT